MRNPFCAFIDWRQQQLAQARDKGGLHLFWFYITLGLVWSLFMTAMAAALDFYHNGALGSDTFHDRATTFFGGGIVYGLLMWTMRKVTGSGRRDVKKS